MIKTYKILSLLLSYPNPELQNFLTDAESELREEALLSEEKISRIAEFCSGFANTDLSDWQAEYVQLFDCSRTVSLHLFEHVKGDSKDRGQAMVDLMEFYREHGMKLTSRELPDYIPVFLEFLSTLSPSKSAALLEDTVNIMDRINLALTEKGNPYSHIFQALISLSARNPDQKINHEMIKNENPHDLDDEYEDMTLGGCEGSVFCDAHQGTGKGVP